MYVHYMPVWGLWRTKRILDRLELDLEVVVSHHVGTETQPRSSARAASVLCL